MELLLDVAMNGLPPLQIIFTAHGRNAASKPYLVRAALGRIAKDQEKLLSDDDPLRQILSDFASDAEEWLLTEFDALAKP